MTDILVQLRPLLLWKKQFKEEQGRNPTDDEHPPELLSLALLYKESQIQLAKLRTKLPDTGPRLSPAQGRVPLGERQAQLLPAPSHHAPHSTPSKLPSTLGPHRTPGKSTLGMAAQMASSLAAADKPSVPEAMVPCSPAASGPSILGPTPAKAPAAPGSKAGWLLHSPASVRKPETIPEEPDVIAESPCLPRAAGPGILESPSIAGAAGMLPGHPALGAQARHNMARPSPLIKARMRKSLDFAGPMREGAQLDAPGPQPAANTQQASKAWADMSKVLATLSSSAHSPLQVRQLEERGHHLAGRAPAAAAHGLQSPLAVLASPSQMRQGFNIIGNKQQASFQAIAQEVSRCQLLESPHVRLAAARPAVPCSPIASPGPSRLSMRGGARRGLFSACGALGDVSDVLLGAAAAEPEPAAAGPTSSPLSPNAPAQQHARQDTARPLLSQQLPTQNLRPAQADITDVLLGISPAKPLRAICSEPVAAATSLLYASPAPKVPSSPWQRGSPPGSAGPKHAPTAAATAAQRICRTARNIARTKGATPKKVMPARVMQVPTGEAEQQAGSTQVDSVAPGAEGMCGSPHHGPPAADAAAGAKSPGLALRRPQRQAAARARGALKKMPTVRRRTAADSDNELLTEGSDADVQSDEMKEGSEGSGDEEEVDEGTASPLLKPARKPPARRRPAARQQGGEQQVGKQVKAASDTTMEPMQVDVEVKPAAARKRGSSTAAAGPAAKRARPQAASRTSKGGVRRTAGRIAVQPSAGGGGGGAAAPAAAAYEGLGASTSGSGASAAAGAAAVTAAGSRATGASTSAARPAMPRPIAAGGSRGAAMMGMAAGPGATAGAAGVAAAARRRAGGTAGRQNFVRYNQGKQGKHSFGYQSKSAANGRTKSARMRLRRVNGKIIRTKFKAPAMAGQGADFLEGFKSDKRCFRCGGAGHWARECPYENGTAADVPQEGEGLAPSSQDAPAGDHVPVGSPAGAEAAAPAFTTGMVPARPAAVAVKQGPPAPAVREPFELAKCIPADMEPPLPEDPTTASDDQLRTLLRGTFGHPDFRGSQAAIIKRVLAGQSMLGILPTGAGKSLCYQFPALLLPGLVLVVSPLLALMRDQVDRLPPCLPGAMLWGGQTRSEAEAVLADAARGALKLLYVAPEKLLTPAVLQALLGMSTPISLVCIDEAHCVAEWGHSFRPAYFRLGHVLRSVIRPRAVLALTATATRPTEQCIAQVLNLPEDGTVRDAPMRPNLRLKVLHSNGSSSSGRAINTVAALLKAGDLEHVSSAIVYCAFQAQADEAAQALQRAGIRAASYHAGKPMEERLSVQRALCTGAVRVVVATVAFGMGVDTGNLGAVLHLALPRSLEDYVQQVGRAGRTGQEASCWLILDDDDFIKLRTLSFSNAAELAGVRGLLGKIFHSGSEGSQFGVLAIKEAAMELDVAEETMETILSYLQGHDGCGSIAALPSTSVYVDVFFHRTQPSVLAKQHPLVAAMLSTKPRVSRGSHRVHMEKLVAAAGMSPSQVLSQLAQLAAKQEVHFELSPARALAWRVLQVPQDLDTLAASLHQRLVKQLAMSVRRLDVIYALMASAAKAGSPEEQEQILRTHIHTYFNTDIGLPEVPAGAELPVKPSVRAPAEVAAFLHSCRDAVQQRERPMTGTAVARIFHGLATPSYPIDQWAKCGFWGKFTRIDFQVLASAAQIELLRFYKQANGQP